MAALGLSGCVPTGDESAPCRWPRRRSQPSAGGAAPPDPGPLPAPEALADVMYRLADPAVPGPEKLALVEDTAPAGRGHLDRFAAALRDGGFTPVTFTADRHEVVGRPSPATCWRPSTSRPPDIRPTPGEFSFPMEFRPHAGGWQLTRETADMLLAFGNARTEAGRRAPHRRLPRLTPDVDRLAGVRHPAR